MAVFESLEPDVHHSPAGQWSRLFCTASANESFSSASISSSNADMSRSACQIRSRWTNLMEM